VALRKIPGPKRREITGDCRKWRHEEVHDLHLRHAARVGEKRNAYRDFVAKHERNRRLEGPGFGWEDNIKMDLKSLGRERGDWMHLVQDWNSWKVLVNMVMRIRVY
jgi:hypothetical protein